MAGNQTLAGKAPLPRRYDAIDLLRFLAALSVLFFHYSFRGAAEGGYTSFSLPAIAPVTKYGYLGVELFFIISGFVITMSAQGRSPAAFARSRVLRLYPAYLVAMTATTVIGVALGQPRFAVTIKDWLANLVPLAPFLGSHFVDGVYWSLELEVVFYVWVGLFLRLGWFQNHRPLILLLWLALSAVINLSVSSKLVHALFLTDYASLFATGIIMFDLSARRSPILLLPLLLAALPMSMLGVLERASYLREVLHAEVDDRVLVLVLAGLHSLFVAALLLRRLPKLAPALAVLGGLSYPLYLMHQYIGYMLLNGCAPLLPAWLAPIVVGGAMVMLSAWVALWIEPIGRAWLGHLIDRAGGLFRSPGFHRAIATSPAAAGAAGGRELTGRHS